jgi:hypothetical protein
LSFVWLNPPFDDGYAGVRIEDEFLQAAADWLMPGGVMAFVCPESVVDDYSDARRHFATYYEQCAIVPFPDGHRSFHEVIVFGHKRARPTADPWDADAERAWESALAPPGFRYRIPPGTGPRVFQKVEPTEAELRRLLAASPLRPHLTATPEARPPSPPLSLGRGHVALLLASGHLDGIVRPSGAAPHVVRGTVRKRAFISDVAETATADGGTTTRTTVSERIELVIRTVDGTGAMRTLAESGASGADEDVGSPPTGGSGPLDGYDRSDPVETLHG